MASLLTVCILISSLAVNWFASFTSAGQIVFNQNLYYFSVLENQPINTYVGKVHSRDSGNLTITYKLIGSNDFTVENSTGEIRTNSVLDYELTSRYILLVLASDTASATSTSTVDVGVHDVNDNSPLFQQSFYDVTLAQSFPVGTSVIAPSATDADHGSAGLIKYSILGDSKDYAIDSSTGVIVKRSQTPVSSVNLTVMATDHGRPPLSSTITVRITTAAPVQVPNLTLEEMCTLSREFYELTVKENAVSGTCILNMGKGIQVNKTDTVSYTLIADYGKFLLTSDGQLVVTGHLDYESKRFYELTVKILNQTETLINVKVTILDVNDFPPMFVGILSPFRVASTFSVGEMIYKFLAWDGDSEANGNNRVSYSLDSNNTTAFSLDKESGVLRTTRTLVAGETFRLRIKAIDQGSPPLHGFTSIEIQVFDPTQNKPIFDATFIPATVQENSPVGTVFAVPHATVLTDTLTSSNSIAYSIIGTSAKAEFTISNVTGVVRTKKSFDREIQERTALVVRATSILDNTHITDMIINVEIADVNDNTPMFPFSCYKAIIPSNSTRGRILYRLQAFDPDMTSQLSYTITDGNQAGFFSVSTRGEVSVEREISNIPSQYNLTVSASDGRFSVTSQLSLTY